MAQKQEKKKTNTLGSPDKVLFDTEDEYFEFSRQRSMLSYGMGAWKWICSTGKRAYLQKSQKYDF